MHHADDVTTSSNVQARSTLLTSAVLTFSGSCVGVLGVVRGNVSGGETLIVVAGGLFGIGLLATLIGHRRVAVQNVATVSTVFFTIYLCAGILVTLLCPGNHEDLFVYLVWCFPLLVFNKLVNNPTIGRLLAKFILIAPLLLMGCLFGQVLALLAISSVYLVGVFWLSYLSFGMMLEAVTRYRETFIIERERLKSLTIEAGVLESISDCFISLDSEFRLVYLNDAACAEFAVKRDAALNLEILDAIPSFVSARMLAELRTAFDQASGAQFETQGANGHWYEMRCFPKQAGMSVYFRNFTEIVLSRHQLDLAHSRLRQQSDLLDKAQDAIFVQDMKSLILYWNQGAERLFGWSAAEVMGKRVGDIFQTSAKEVRQAFSSVMQNGEWTGELSKRHKDGRTLIVASRCTLVRGDDSTSHSILAINTDITDRRAADAKIHNLAFHDVLTGLPNRTLLRERLEKVLTSAKSEQDWGALMLIDLDDFKTLNDTSGHDVGDCLLQEVAVRLSSCLRQCDMTARLGGDEFVVVLDNLPEDAEAAIAETKLWGDRVLRACRKPYVLPHQGYEGTATIGVTLFQGRGDTVDELLKRADLAMYRAKSEGRNRLCFFNPEMQSAAALRVALLTDLKRAVQNDELELHYQPQVSSDRSVVGCEALLRWRHPERGMIPPNQFIPLAESDGLIVDLGYWVLETACRQLAIWAQQPETQDLTMAVNVSIRQFQDSRFVQRVETALGESGANPHRLKLEITESFMMDRVDVLIGKMSALKAHGIGFSLDDFGTGYSSLSQLKGLPLDQLKIDQSFVSDVLTSASNASIVRTIITLGRSLNLTVIAEGVETKQQQQFLEEQGCYEYQGYYFSPALSPFDFETFVKQEYRVIDASLSLSDGCEIN
jgi:diguanylate cyclase (GGDEF)-like protein/PAS domain S-box-containing protein